MTLHLFVNSLTYEIGFWNSCWGWSATLNHGTTNAYIHFNMMDEIAASLYAKYLPIVIVGMALQLALTLALLGISQGKAGSDFSMEDQALHLYRRLLHQPELKPGARSRMQQVCIESYYFLLRWRPRGDRYKGVESIALTTKIFSLNHLRRKCT
jgi:hypothetical protein